MCCLGKLQAGSQPDAAISSSKNSIDYLIVSRELRDKTAKQSCLSIFLEETTSWNKSIVPPNITETDISIQRLSSHYVHLDYRLRCNQSKDYSNSSSSSWFIIMDSYKNPPHYSDLDYMGCLKLVPAASHQWIESGYWGHSIARPNHTSANIIISFHVSRSCDTSNFVMDLIWKWFIIQVPKQNCCFGGNLAILHALRETTSSG